VREAPIQSQGLIVKVVVTIALESRCLGDTDLLEACVRDGVWAFNQHVDHGAKVEHVRLLNDQGTWQRINETAIKPR
jgi:hypothetical protein